MTPFIHVSDHTLFAPLLRPGMTVLDGGANHGRFSRDLQRHFPGQYHAVEANPDLVPDLDESQVFTSVRAGAISASAGTIAFHLGQNDETSSILTLPDAGPFGAIRVATVEVESIRLAELITRYEKLDVVKLDIEGAEVAAILDLATADLAHVVQMTVEFHGGDEFGFSLDSRVTDVLDAMRGHGFVRLDFATDHRNSLFINRRHLQPTIADLFSWRLRALEFRHRQRLESSPFIGRRLPTWRGWLADRFR